VLALPRSLRFTLVAVGGVAFAGATLSPAWAQGKLDARYTASLAGIPIGKGSWVIDITDTSYTATATGATTGLLHAFTGGEGTSTVRGTLQAGQPLSSVYATTIITGKKNDEIHLTINNGTLKDFKVDPPQDNDAERVPVTEAHQHGILDPMTASLLHTSGNGDPLTADVCQRSQSIFDGRLRYDLQFAFKRMDKVKANKGYAGPVVVCAVYFTPIAGHIPSRTAIKYVAKLRDIEIWLAPIAGTRVLVPFRLEGPTPIGQAVLEATQFISVASPPRAPANGAKTQ
jgi:hypothetical protein